MRLGCAIKRMLCKLESKVQVDIGKIGEVISSAGKYSEEHLFREMHQHATEFEQRIKVSLYDLIRARFIRKSMRDLNVLWIENNPDRQILKIDKQFESNSTPGEGPLIKFNGNPEIGEVIATIMKTAIPNGRIYLVKENFNRLRKILIDSLHEDQTHTIQVEVDELTGGGSTNPKITIDLSEDVDFVLLDVYLDEGKKVSERVDGVELVNLLRETVPHIPVFILSISDDYQITRKTINGGADFHVTKRQLLSVPYLYAAYIGEIGNIISFIQDDKLRKSLLGNIRYWNFKRNYLWFGDKCYHMIDHSFNHISDDWKFANRILAPLLRNRSIWQFLSAGHGGDERDRILYAFSMAIWLHDIGHKGNRRYNEAHLIRDTHGIISGELILSNPKFFGIKELLREDEEINRFYESLSFPVGEVEKKPVIQVILERIKARKLYEGDRKRLTITEMIALFSIYHKSNSPINEKDYYVLVEKERYIPLDFYEYGKRDNRVITLERILNELNDEKFKEVFLSLMALLRLVDSIDIKVSRVGDPLEKGLKLRVIKEDLKSVLERLKILVERWAQSFQKEHERMIFIKNFYQDVSEKIERGETISINRLGRLLEQFPDLESYRMLVNYAYFIKAQPGHFNLHASVDDIEIEHAGAKSFKIRLITSKTRRYLEKERVFETSQTEESLYERLIGKERCYILNEIKEMEDYIKNFIDHVEIELYSKSEGKVLNEEPVIWFKRR